MSVFYLFCLIVLSVVDVFAADNTISDETAEAQILKWVKAKMKSKKYEFDKCIFTQQELLSIPNLDVVKLVRDSEEINYTTARSSFVCFCDNQINYGETEVTHSENARFRLETIRVTSKQNKYDWNLRFKLPSFLQTDTFVLNLPRLSGKMDRVTVKPDQQKLYATTDVRFKENDSVELERIKAYFTLTFELHGCVGAVFKKGNEVKKIKMIPIANCLKEVFGGRFVSDGTVWRYTTAGVLIGEIYESKKVS